MEKKYRIASGRNIVAKHFCPRRGNFILDFGQRSLVCVLKISLAVNADDTVCPRAYIYVLKYFFWVNTELSEAEYTLKNAHTNICIGMLICDFINI